MELRTYSLADANAQRQYTAEFWPRHIPSLCKYGITVHGVWTDTGTSGHRVVALVGYPPDGDPTRLAKTYRDSSDYAEDHMNFDESLILWTQTLTLEPVAGSPLQ